MARRLKNAFKTVKIRASNFNAVGSTTATDHLEELYMTLEAKKVDAVSASRKAALATAEAEIKKAEAQKAELAIITAAGEYDNRIAGERVWMVYREGESNELTFEGITERLLRNNFRAQQAMIGKNMQNDDSSSELDNMFEDDEEDE